MHGLVATLVKSLDSTLREEFEERAGIVEFDGKLPRLHAEALAILDVLRRHPAALIGVTVLKLRVNGAQQWLLSTDLKQARHRLAITGGVVTVVGDLAEVVQEKYDGLAIVNGYV